jgi:predicted nucleic acid-binding protein
MNVLVDTSVWSIALRKRTISKREEKVVQELKELIYELRVVMIGPIRQELLSGISDNKKFRNLKEKIESFEDLPVTQEDYETAAEISNICRKRGTQGTHTDFLICAVALKNDINIFTTDRDFNNYKKHVKINLHDVREKKDN